MSASNILKYLWVSFSPSVMIIIIIIQHKASEIKIKEMLIKKLIMIVNASAKRLKKNNIMPLYSSAVALKQDPRVKTDKIFISDVWCL